MPASGEPQDREWGVCHVASYAAFFADEKCETVNSTTADTSDGAENRQASSQRHQAIKDEVYSRYKVPWCA